MDNQERQRHLAIVAGNDQDHAELRSWLRETDPENIAAVWDEIQGNNTDDPCTQVLMRFAQYGLASLYAEHLEAANADE